MPDHHDAELILKLYDLRRETKMREARQYMTFEWSPKSTDDVVATYQNPENSWKLRQFASYWEMACGLVNAGTIDAELFAQSNGEFWPFYVKIQPFLEDLRKQFSPKMCQQIEKFIHSRPDWKETINMWKTRLESMKK